MVIGANYVSEWDNSANDRASMKERRMQKHGHYMLPDFHATPNSRSPPAWIMKDGSVDRKSCKTSRNDSHDLYDDDYD
jgi:hypothetical protein